MYGIVKTDSDSISSFRRVCIYCLRLGAPAPPNPLVRLKASRLGKCDLKELPNPVPAGEGSNVDPLVPSAHQTRRSLVTAPTPPVLSDAEVTGLGPHQPLKSLFPSRRSQLI